MSSVTRVFVGLSQFQKVGLTLGKALSVVVNTNAKIPAYLFGLDFGTKLLTEHETLYRKKSYISSAQLTENHKDTDLVGKLFLCVYNFPRKQIGNKVSDCLVTGVQEELSNPEAKRKTTVYMTPSCDVAPGAVVGILGEDKIYESNARDLNWVEFAVCDFRIGTVASAALSGNLVNFTIDLGAGPVSGVGIADQKLVDSLKGKQVMVLTNLDPQDVSQQFSGSTASVVLVTVAGKAVLQPAIPVKDGFKLA